MLVAFNATDLVSRVGIADVHLRGGGRESGDGANRFLLKDSRFLFWWSAQLS